MESPPSIKPLAAGLPAVDPELLGPCLQSWRFSPLRWRLGQAAIILGGSFACLAAIVVAAGDTSFIARNPTFVVGASLALAAIPLLAVLLQRADQLTLELRPRGLAFSGTHTGVMPWAHILAVSVEPGGHEDAGQRTYLWRCNVASRAWHLHFGSGHLPGRAISKLIAEQTLPLVWEHLRAALAAGREFRLGALVVTPTGFRVSSTTIPWHDVATIAIDGRYIKVCGKNRRLDGELRVLRHQVHFEAVLERLEEATFAYRFGTAPELHLPELPQRPTARGQRTARREPRLPRGESRGRPRQPRASTAPRLAALPRARDDRPGATEPNAGGSAVAPPVRICARGRPESA
jgi:hypothetical protein